MSVCVFLCMWVIERLFWIKHLISYISRSHGVVVMVQDYGTGGPRFNPHLCQIIFFSSLSHLHWSKWSITINKANRREKIRSSVLCVCVCMMTMTTTTTKNRSFQLSSGMSVCVRDKERERVFSQTSSSRVVKSTSHLMCPSISTLTLLYYKHQ